MYKEKSDSEPEVEESQCTHEEDLVKEEKEEKEKQPAPKRKNKTFHYLIKDAKRNKR